MQVPNVTVEDLDTNAIERFKKLAVGNKRLSADEVKIDDKGLLENLKLLMRLEEWLLNVKHLIAI